MGHLSAKNKILVIGVLWFIISGTFFFYGFNLLDVSNEKLIASLNSKRSELYALRSLQESYNTANKDLENVKKEPYQPQDFFSQDITLVNEIKTLENLSQQLQVSINLAGIGGTINSAPLAKTQSSLVMIPYSLTITGKLTNVVKFIENLEHLSFITDVSALNITPAENNQINAALNARFYLKK